MTDDENWDDEDVIFEGSTLHQHLLDTGYTDFEASQFCQSTTTHEHPTTNSTKNAKNSFGPLNEKLKLFCAATTGSWLREPIVTWGVSRAVIEAGLISEDDWILLDHFLPEGVKECHSSKSYSHSIWRILLQLIPVDMWILMVLLMLGFGMLASIFNFWYLYSLSVVLIFFTLIILSHGYYLLKSYHLVKQVKKVVYHLRDFSHIVSKSLRLLQEVDLIAKGFVLAQGSSNTKFLVENDNPQSFTLRDALNKSLGTVTPILFTNHQFLDQFTSMYPCMRQLFDDMPHVPENCKSSEYLLYLKKWVAVMKIQLSTVMTELLLSVHQKSGVHLLFNFHADIFSVSQSSVIDTEMKSLWRHYDFTKSFLFEDRDRKKEGSLEDKKKDVYIAVHSLSLHMQAALFRIHNLEGDFESDSSSNDNQNLEQKNLPELDYVREQFDIIKRELESCQGCLEEAEARVDRKYGVCKAPSSEEPLDSSISNIGEETTTKTPKSVIVLSALEDPVIEDEVFEAYIDQEYNRLNEYDDDLNADVKKERRILKQQKEQGKRVLKELQPILVNRRKMWEKREEIALNKHQKAEENPLKEDVDEKGSKTDNPLKQNQAFEDRIEEDKIISLSNIKKTGHLERQKQNLDDDFDSEEERLETYRKLRKELDEDEKKRKEEEQNDTVFKVSLKDLEKQKCDEEELDSEEERLESYRKLRKELDEDEKLRREEEQKDTVFKVNLKDLEKQKCDEEELDSEEERLETYRKLRKELDEDEKMRREEEQKDTVFKVSLQDLEEQKCYEEELDSEEERLETYRKLRKEMDEDEKNRDECTGTLFSLKDLQPHKTMMKASDSSTEYCLKNSPYQLFTREEVQSVSSVNQRNNISEKDTAETKNNPNLSALKYPKECLPQNLNTEERVYSVSSDNQRTNTNESDIVDSENNSSLDKNNVDSRNNPNLSVLKYPNLINNGSIGKNLGLAETTFSDSDDEMNMEETNDREDETYEDGDSDSLDTDCVRFRLSEENQDKEETYEDGDGASDMECVRFCLPPHPTNTLADRMQLYSGGTGVGFHAEVAAQAIAASRLFRQAPSSVEVFDGVGEGEVFGDSDDDDEEEEEEEEKI